MRREMADGRWARAGNYLLEVSFSAIWGVSPILCVLVSFWIYTAPWAVNKEVRLVSWTLPFARPLTSH